MSLKKNQRFESLTGTTFILSVLPLLFEGHMIKVTKLPNVQICLSTLHVHSKAIFLGFEKLFDL